MIPDETPLTFEGIHKTLNELVARQRRIETRAVKIMYAVGVNDRGAPLGQCDLGVRMPLSGETEMNQLEQLKAAYSAATPERWGHDAEPDGHAIVVDCQDVIICRTYQQPFDTWSAGDNAIFITLAHNLMPALLEAVRCVEDILGANGDLSAMDFDAYRGVLESLK